MNNFRLSTNDLFLIIYFKDNDQDNYNYVKNKHHVLYSQSTIALCVLKCLSTAPVFIFIPLRVIKGRWHFSSPDARIHMQRFLSQVTLCMTLYSSL